MDLSTPIADVVPGSRGAVLAALVRLGRPVSGRELAGQAAVSPATAQRIVDDLAESGLVTLNPVGRSVLVSLNRRHLAVPALEKLVGLRAELIEDLRSAIAGWAEPARAGWLFGSAARADGDRHSDIDIVVVARRKRSPAWDEQVDELVLMVSQRTGNPCQVIDYSSGDFRHLVQSANPLIRSLQREGIELIGGSRSLFGRSK